MKLLDKVKKWHREQQTKKSIAKKKEIRDLENQADTLEREAKQRERIARANKRLEKAKKKSGGSSLWDQFCDWGEGVTDNVNRGLGYPSSGLGTTAPRKSRKPRKKKPKKSKKKRITIEI